MATPRLQPGHESWELAVEATRRRANGESVKEVAEALGAPEGTIPRWVRRVNEYNKIDPAVQNAMAAVGTGMRPVLTWAKTGPNGEVSYSTLLKPGDDADTIADIIDEACAALKERSPAVPIPEYISGDHMLVMTPADIHMGKLSEALETGDEYTQEIAEQRTKEGVAALLGMASAFGIECITVNTGNDSLHVDNSKNTTTKGTPQDTQGSIFSMFTAMQRTWIWVIEQCASVAPVRVVFDPSNHPWVSDWMLNQNLAAWFHNDERVTFDVYQSAIRHRKYQVYGSNLIGYTHGDGAKSEDLAKVMQYECREWWGRTRRGFWIVKHKHHKDAKVSGLAPYEMEKDHPGLTVIRSGDTALDRNVAVEVVRSPSGTDGWHDRNAYVGAIKAVEAFLFHSERGQVARFTYPFY